MSDDRVLEELIETLVHKYGANAGRITPRTRIVQDLGIDGDDAAELVNDLTRRFGTDFSALGTHWDEFFSAEGISLRIILLVVIVAGFSGAIAAHMHFQKPMAFVLAAVVFASAWWFYARRAAKKMKTLTVGELVETVRAGRWPVNRAKLP